MDREREKHKQSKINTGRATERETNKQSKRNTYRDRERKSLEDKGRERKDRERER